MSIATRKTGTSDLPEVMSLIAAAIAGMRFQGIDQWDEIYPDEKTILSDIDEGSLFVLTSGGRVAGIVVINEKQEEAYQGVSWQFTAGRCCVVHRLCVHPDFENQGIGKRLMACAEEQARARGYNLIRLDAFSKNPKAIRFYKKLGFRQAGEVRFRKGVFFCFEKQLKISLT
jgi:GNAT superfamily N-acetyltransferase